MRKFILLWKEPTAAKSFNLKIYPRLLLNTGIPIELTVFNLTLFIGHVLKVIDDGAAGQVVEGLVPQLLMNLFLTFTATQKGLDIKHNLPLHWFSAQQSRHHSLAVTLVLVGSIQMCSVGILWGFCSA